MRIQHPKLDFFLSFLYLVNLATQREINSINMLFGLVELLIIGQKPTNDIYPWGYENSWVIYESGTATTLGEVISVKVTAHVHVGYEISLSYNINFHGNLKRNFLLGHWGAGFAVRVFCKKSQVPHQN